MIAFKFYSVLGGVVSLYELKYELGLDKLAGG
jgi:hypothetical protein